MQCLPSCAKINHVPRVVCVQEFGEYLTYIVMSKNYDFYTIFCSFQASSVLSEVFSFGATFERDFEKVEKRKVGWPVAMLWGEFEAKYVSVLVTTSHTELVYLYVSDKHISFLIKNSGNENFSVIFLQDNETPVWVLKSPPMTKTHFFSSMVPHRLPIFIVWNGLWCRCYFTLNPSPWIVSLSSHAWNICVSEQDCYHGMRSIGPFWKWETIIEDWNTVSGIEFG